MQSNGEAFVVRELISYHLESTRSRNMLNNRKEPTINSPKFHVFIFESCKFFFNSRRLTSPLNCGSTLRWTRDRNQNFILFFVPFLRTLRNTYRFSLKNTARFLERWEKLMIRRWEIPAESSIETDDWCEWKSNRREQQHILQHNKINDSVVPHTPHITRHTRRLCVSWETYHRVEGETRKQAEKTVRIVNVPAAEPTGGWEGWCEKWEWLTVYVCDWAEEIFPMSKWGWLALSLSGYICYVVLPKTFIFSPSLTLSLVYVCARKGDMRANW